MKLHELGWNAHFEKEFAQYSGRGPAAGTLVPARVAAGNRQFYTLLWEGPDLTAEVSGKFRANAASRHDFPAVGDWVAVSPLASEGKGIIHALLPRTSLFQRRNPGPTTEEQVAAANIDTVFIVSAADWDFNPRRVERYLALAWNSGAVPVVVLNKVDLSEDPAELVTQLQSVAIGVPVIPVSAERGEGIEQLLPHLAAGRTSVLLGSSGVGKSTLINRLLEADLQEVQEVREDDSRGRHTTTLRELFILPGGGIVIDSPGMREVGLWEEDGLEQTFSDIEELAAGCRFGDCSHNGEPGCAVRQALDESRLDVARYQSYMKLAKETRWIASRQDQKAWQARRRREKELSKFQKRLKKEKS